MKLLRKTSPSGWFFVEELPDGSEGRVIFAQGQPVPIELAEEITGCVSTGWMPWLGGGIPANAIGRRVDIQLRDGEIWQNRPSEDVIWRHVQTDADVVFWRPAPRGDWVGAPESDANSWHDIPDGRFCQISPSRNWMSTRPTASAGMVPPCHGRHPALTHSAISDATLTGIGWPCAKMTWPFSSA
jgi:hypothetical protein